MKVEALYPEVANLYGELGNIMYLKASFEESNVPIEVIETSLNQRPQFLDPENEIDFVYLGTVTERSQEIITEKFRSFEGDLKAAIERGVHILITGNSLEIFGSGVREKDGTGFDGLGMFPFHTTRNMMQHFNAFSVSAFDGTPEKPVVGFQCQFTHSYYDVDIKENTDMKPLFVTERGPGFHPGISEEGLRYKNLMLTYVIGPLFALNPYFMMAILKEIGIENVHPAHEKAAAEAYEIRLKEFRDPNREDIY